MNVAFTFCRPFPIEKLQLVPEQITPDVAPLQLPKADPEPGVAVSVPNVTVGGTTGTTPGGACTGATSLSPPVMPIASANAARLCPPSLTEVPADRQLAEILMREYIRFPKQPHQRRTAEASTAKSELWRHKRMENI